MRRLANKSLALHDAVWYDQYAYLPFRETWPILHAEGNKRVIGSSLTPAFMELDVWNSTACTGASFDESSPRFGALGAGKNGEPPGAAEPSQSW